MPNKILEQALRAKEIVQNSFPLDKRNTRHVSAAKMGPTKTGFKVVTVTKEPGIRARSHVVLVDMEPGYSGKFNNCPHVRIDCDCGRHLFVWNYALLKHDAAIRDRTNGEPPDQTNPSQVPGCCKHGLIALRFLGKSNPSWTSTATASKAPQGPIRLTTLRRELRHLHNGDE